MSLYSIDDYYNGYQFIKTSYPRTHVSEDCPSDHTPHDRGHMIKQSRLSYFYPSCSIRACNDKMSSTRNRLQTNNYHFILEKRAEEATSSLLIYVQIKEMELNQFSFVYSTWLCSRRSYKKETHTIYSLFIHYCWLCSTVAVVIYLVSIIES